MNHKELTNHIRNRIKAAGIKARVKMNEACGSKYITVVVPRFDARFTSDQIRTIATIAQCNRLTFVRGMQIDPASESQLTEKLQWDFYL